VGDVAYLNWPYQAGPVWLLKAGHTAANHAAHASLDLCVPLTHLQGLLTWPGAWCPA
jgi:hypothetical protein